MNALALLGLGVALQAADVDLTKLPPPSKQKGLTYAKDIKPMFESSCFRCHGEERHKKDLRLDSLEAVLKGGEDGKVVIPGQSTKSPLVIAVARLDDETAMPPKPKPGRGPGGPGGGPGAPPPGGPGGPPPGAKDGNAPRGFGSPGGPGGPGGPPGGFKPVPPLTADQVGLIRAWIDQGAK